LIPGYKRLFLYLPIHIQNGYGPLGYL